MAEFTSELKRTGRPVTLYISIAIAAVAMVAVLLVIRYQKNSPPPAAAGPVAVEGMVHPGDVDFEAYKDKVRIEDVKASIGINFAGNRSAWIDGTIANEGSRNLEAVEMRVTLYDVYDKVSKERTVTPLRPGVGLAAGPMKPLERRGFHIGIESVEQLWNPKRVEIKVTGLKYR